MAAQQSALSRALDNRTTLGLLFMVPAAGLLLVFLTYPLGLGTWLGFTDARIGRSGEWIGIENFTYLWGDEVMRLAVFNTIFYTVVASVIKFGLGLWLALLLNKHLPFKAFLRAIVLLPFIVPTALSAIAFWWIYDSQFSIISWALVKMGIITTYIDFLGQPWHARFATIAANIWRGVPFVAITLLAGLQTISPSYYEAASLDGASDWQQFRFVTLPLLTPTMFFIVIILLINSFQVFDQFWLMPMPNSAASRQVQVIVTEVVRDAFSYNRMGYASAMSWVLFILIFIITFVQLRFQKRWVHYETE